jgi:hypothetical protein
MGKLVGLGILHAIYTAEFSNIFGLVFAGLSLTVLDDRGDQPFQSGTGHAEPFGGAVYPQSPFSRREAGQALRFGHRPPDLFRGSDFRLREIEDLLVAAHDAQIRTIQLVL